jgi:nucleoid-associated protein YgaU
MITKYTEDLQIEKTIEGKSYYTTIIPTSIPEDSFQFSIVTRGIERFDNLAYKYYGDATKWWIIAKANEMVNGTLFIEPGTQLIIPSAGL